VVRIRHDDADELPVLVVSELAEGVSSDAA
jgi:hypothetical protein